MSRSLGLPCHSPWWPWFAEACPTEVTQIWVLEPPCGHRRYCWWAGASFPSQGGQWLQPGLDPCCPALMDICSGQKRAQGKKIRTYVKIKQTEGWIPLKPAILLHQLPTGHQPCSAQVPPSRTNYCQANPRHHQIAQIAQYPSYRRMTKSTPCTWLMCLLNLFILFYFLKIFGSSSLFSFLAVSLMKTLSRWDRDVWSCHFICSSASCVSCRLVARNSVCWVSHSFFQ